MTIFTSIKKTHAVKSLSLKAFRILCTLFIMASLMFSSQNSFALKYKSVQSGNWEDGATWGKTSPGVAGVDYPDPIGSPDTVIIDHGHSVTLTSTTHMDGVGYLVVRSGATIDGTKLEFQENAVGLVKVGGTIDVDDLHNEGSSVLTNNGTITTSNEYKQYVSPGATLNNNSIMTIGGRFRVEESGSVTNNGTITVGGKLNLLNSSSFINECTVNTVYFHTASGATYTNNGPTTISGDDDDDELQNEGTVVNNNSFSVTDGDANFDNDGTLTGDGGNYHFADDVLNYSGTITCGGSAIWVCADVINDGTINGCVIQCPSAENALAEAECGSGIAMPVELSEFNASVMSDNSVLLEWSVFTEELFSHYEIERSKDGRNWAKVGKTKSRYVDLVGGGSYDFTDIPEVATATLYYRLKMVDLDGTYEYSNIESVQLAAAPVSVVVYPNPVKGQLNLTVSNHMFHTIRIMNISGQVLKLATIDESASIAQLDVNDLPAGMYFMHVSGMESSTTISFTKN